VRLKLMKHFARAICRKKSYTLSAVDLSGTSAQRDQQLKLVTFSKWLSEKLKTWLHFTHSGPGRVGGRYAIDKIY